MNSPGRVIGFVNAAHFIDHYSMLIFAAAVIVMGPALGIAPADVEIGGAALLALSR